MAKALGRLIPSLVKTTFRRKGFDTPRLVLDWPDIVGKELAAYCFPQRISFPKGSKTGGTLHLWVDPSQAYRFPYIKDLIIERLNRHYGYGALERLSLYQRPMAYAKKASSPSPQKPKGVAPDFSPTGHDALDEALASYGSYFPHGNHAVFKK